MGEGRGRPVGSAPPPAVCTPPEAGSQGLCPAGLVEAGGRELAHTGHLTAVVAQEHTCQAASPESSVASLLPRRASWVWWYVSPFSDVLLLHQLPRHLCGSGLPLGWPWSGAGMGPPFLEPSELGLGQVGWLRGSKSRYQAFICL